MTRWEVSIWLPSSCSRAMTAQGMHQHTRFSRQQNGNTTTRTHYAAKTKQQERDQQLEAPCSQTISAPSSLRRGSTESRAEQQRALPEIKQVKLQLTDGGHEHEVVHGDEHVARLCLTARTARKHSGASADHSRRMRLSTSIGGSTRTHHAGPFTHTGGQSSRGNGGTARITSGN